VARNILIYLAPKRMQNFSLHLTCVATLPTNTLAKQQARHFPLTSVKSHAFQPEILMRPNDDHRIPVILENSRTDLTQGKQQHPLSQQYAQFMIGWSLEACHLYECLCF